MSSCCYKSSVFPKGFSINHQFAEMLHKLRHRLPWELLVAMFFLYSHCCALKCYVGSKGLSNNGKAVHSFLPNECEEQMTHCFESYTDDMTQITASCQSLNTEQRLLDVCKEGCRNHTDLHITICCCDSDLCNLPPQEKKKAEATTAGTTATDNDPVEGEERNSTTNSTEAEEDTLLGDILEHPKLLRLPHAL